MVCSGQHVRLSNKLRTEAKQRSKVHSTLPQIWVVSRHQYGISALVSQKSFRGETSGSVGKCRLFSQAMSLYHLSVSRAKQNHEESAELILEGSRKFIAWLVL